MDTGKRRRQTKKRTLAATPSNVSSEDETDARTVEEEADAYNDNHGASSYDMQGEDARFGLVCRHNSTWNWTQAIIVEDRQ
jgi:hypothetical protein